MHHPNPFLFFGQVLVLLLLATATTKVAAAEFLNITTISASNGESTIECWRLASPFTTSSTPGTSGTAVTSLGEAGNVSYLSIPPKFDGGLHNAPAVQWVAFTSGTIHITLPCNTTNSHEAWIKGGSNGLILATDTAQVSKQGHITRYPSNFTTIGIAIPLEDGKVPEHTVLHGGQCRGQELAVNEGRNRM